MRYPEKRVIYLAPEIPALSATFVYNEIFHFQTLVCPVEAVSVHRPHSSAGKDVSDRLGDVYYLYEKGTITRIFALVRMLFRRPFKFFAAFFMLLKDILSLGVFSRTAVGLVYRFVSAALLAERMLERNIDHVHVHFAHVPTDLAMYASAMTGVPFSITGHANDIFERGWLLKQKSERAKFLATISNYNKRILIGTGCDQKNVPIVRCGIDEREFEYRTPESADREILNIGSLGRMVPKKGFDTLLRAMEKLKDQSINFVLVLAGDGPEADELRKLSEALGLAEQVKFLGPLPHSEVSSWMSSLDVFALACRQDENGDIDGIPVVLMEAMAIGVPVVTTNVSGLPELVVDGETGVVSEQNDADGLTRSIMKLAASLELRQKLAKNAKDHVDSDFSIRLNVEKLGDLIFSPSQASSP